MDSILISIKKLLGMTDDCTAFDMDIIMHINTVFSILSQIGVGPQNGFSIQNEIPIWNDFISADSRLEMVKTYVYMKVRLLFDPPTSSSIIESINRVISEIEWRLLVETDPVIQNEQTAEREEVEYVQ